LGTLGSRVAYGTLISDMVPNDCRIKETLFEVNTLVVVDAKGCWRLRLDLCELKHVGVDVDVNSMFNDTIDRILKWSLRRNLLIQPK
jgi:hypothetical protein